ncbi:MAG: disulfide bond formation protein B [Rhodopseudomonas palustris]|uniref:Disulfide bond formation protein B n=1 Tax=Rhodopseudomonas palustris TaxID=1076 RepID=A0A933RY81_RHOPL|nr:disulfide bond formation protein B [Rhodopseudomonas palustris]
MTADFLDTPVAASRASRVARNVALAIGAVSVAALATVWYFQLFLDFKPCPLCLEQRYAYYAAIPLAALLAFAAARGAPAWLLTVGLALLALGNAGLGAYHAGVEWKFWAGPTDCSGPVLDLGKAGSLLEQLDKVKVVRCDEVQWRFLGLSFAGYNVLLSLGLAALAGWGIARIRR